MRQVSLPYTPQQNGMAKQMNKTLQDVWPYHVENKNSGQIFIGRSN